MTFKALPTSLEYYEQLLIISCTKYPNQNIEDVVIKKNNHVNAIESLWLLKNVGLDFSTFFVPSELKKINVLAANIINAIPAI